MVFISRENAADILTARQAPAAFCESGDTVIFETRDCYDDNDITEENPLGTKGEKLENPSTGPLFVEGAWPGALLSVGDLHALMGDGETGICGLETAGEVTVQVTVIKEAEKRKNPEEFRIFQAMRGALPLLAEGGQLMTIQSAETLDQAAFLAANRMRELAAAASGMDLVNSGMAMSLLGDLAVCQIVNPLKTVRCQFPLEVLARYGFCLD